MAEVVNISKSYSLSRFFDFMSSEKYSEDTKISAALEEEMKIAENDLIGDVYSYARKKYGNKKGFVEAEYSVIKYVVDNINDGRKIEVSYVSSKDKKTLRTIELIVSEQMIKKYLTNEQIHALALAIRNHQKEDKLNGFILGDEMGFGKTRVMSLFTFYCLKKNIPVFFITSKNIILSQYVTEIINLFAEYLDFENKTEEEIEQIILSFLNVYSINNKNTVYYEYNKENKKYTVNLQKDRELFGIFNIEKDRVFRDIIKKIRDDEFISLTYNIIRRCYLSKDILKGIKNSVDKNVANVEDTYRRLLFSRIDKKIFGYLKYQYNNMSDELKEYVKISGENYDIDINNILLIARKRYYEILKSNNIDIILSTYSFIENFVEDEVDKIFSNTNDNEKTDIIKYFLSEKNKSNKNKLSLKLAKNIFYCMSRLFCYSVIDESHNIMGQENLSNRSKNEITLYYFVYYVSFKISIENPNPEFYFYMFLKNNFMAFFSSATAVKKNPLIYYIYAPYTNLAGVVFDKRFILINNIISIGKISDENIVNIKEELTKLLTIDGYYLYRHFVRPEPYYIKIPDIIENEYLKDLYNSFIKRIKLITLSHILWKNITERYPSAVLNKEENAEKKEGMLFNIKKEKIYELISPFYSGSQDELEKFCEKIIKLEILIRESVTFVKTEREFKTSILSLHNNFNIIVIKNKLITSETTIIIKDEDFIKSLYDKVKKSSDESDFKVKKHDKINFVFIDDSESIQKILEDIHSLFNRQDNLKFDVTRRKDIFNYYYSKYISDNIEKVKSIFIHDEDNGSLRINIHYNDFLFLDGFINYLLSNIDEILEGYTIEDGDIPNEFIGLLFLRYEYDYDIVSMISNANFIKMFITCLKTHEVYKMVSRILNKKSVEGVDEDFKDEHKIVLCYDRTYKEFLKKINKLSIKHLNSPFVENNFSFILKLINKYLFTNSVTFAGKKISRSFGDVNEIFDCMRKLILAHDKVVLNEDIDKKYNLNVEDLLSLKTTEGQNLNIEVAVFRNNEMYNYIYNNRYNLIDENICDKIPISPYDYIFSKFIKDFSTEGYSMLDISGKDLYIYEIEEGKYKGKSIIVSKGEYEKILQEPLFVNNIVEEKLKYVRKQDDESEQISGDEIEPSAEIEDINTFDYVDENPEEPEEELEESNEVDYEKDDEDEEDKTNNIESYLTKDKIDIINKFNNDKKCKLIILNRSGSESISLHSSELFEDKSRRVMIIVEAEENVVNEVQKRGRVFRRGQINEPVYIYPYTSVPYEKRIVMMLKKKIQHLEASRFGDKSKSSFSSDELNIVEDVINPVGGKILLNMITEGMLDDIDRYYSLLIISPPMLIAIINNLNITGQVARERMQRRRLYKDFETLVIEKFILKYYYFDYDLQDIIINDLFNTYKKIVSIKNETINNAIITSINKLGIGGLELLTSMGSNILDKSTYSANAMSIISGKGFNYRDLYKKMFRYIGNDLSHKYMDYIEYKSKNVFRSKISLSEYHEAIVNNIEIDNNIAFYLYTLISNFIISEWINYIVSTENDKKYSKEAINEYVDDYINRFFRYDSSYIDLKEDEKKVIVEKVVENVTQFSDLVSDIKNNYTIIEHNGNVYYEQKMPFGFYLINDYVGEVFLKRIHNQIHFVSYLCSEVQKIVNLINLEGRQVIEGKEFDKSEKIRTIQNTFSRLKNIEKSSPFNFIHYDANSISDLYDVIDKIPFSFPKKYLKKKYNTSNISIKNKFEKIPYRIIDKTIEFGMREKKDSYINVCSYNYMARRFMESIIEEKKQKLKDLVNQSNSQFILAIKNEIIETIDQSFDDFINFYLTRPKSFISVFVNNIVSDIKEYVKEQYFKNNKIKEYDNIFVVFSDILEYIINDFDIAPYEISRKSIFNKLYKEVNGDISMINYSGLYSQLNLETVKEGIKELRGIIKNAIIGEEAEEYDGEEIKDKDDIIVFNIDKSAFNFQNLILQFIFNVFDIMKEEFSEIYNEYFINGMQIFNNNCINPEGMMFIDIPNYVNITYPDNYEDEIKYLNSIKEKFYNYNYIEYERSISNILGKAINNSVNTTQGIITLKYQASKINENLPYNIMFYIESIDERYTNIDFYQVKITGEWKSTLSAQTGDIKFYIPHKNIYSNFNIYYSNIEDDIIKEKEFDIDVFFKKFYNNCVFIRKLEEINKKQYYNILYKLVFGNMFIISMNKMINETLSKRQGRQVGQGGQEGEGQSGGEQLFDSKIAMFRFINYHNNRIFKVNIDDKNSSLVAIIERDDININSLNKEKIGSIIEAIDNNKLNIENLFTKK